MCGRNEPCPCGSGKKYKKCHLDADIEQAREDQLAASPEPLPLPSDAELKADWAQQQARWEAHPALELLDNLDFSKDECDVYDRAEEAGGATEGDAINEAYCQAHPDSYYAFLWESEKGPEAEAQWLAKYEHVWADKNERINQVLDDLRRRRITRTAAERQLTALYGARQVVHRATSHEVTYGPA